MNNYELNVISKLKQFDGKVMKKYNVEGIDTVGVWGSENFEIEFRNNTAEKVQAIISLDGTNILNGEKAATDNAKDSFVVNAFSSIRLKAWCESHHGGAEFIFTHAGNAVAAHTHGDISSLGFIAAAVFREGYKEPQRFLENHFTQPDKYESFTWAEPYTLVGVNDGGTYGSSISCNTADNMFSTQVSSTPGIGAGQYVDQKITYIEGLKKPYFTESIRVRYLWWDNLVEALKSVKCSVAHASGFPGDKPKVNLGTTPRVGVPCQTKTSQNTNYARF